MAKDKPQVSVTDLDELRTWLDRKGIKVDFRHANSKTALHLAAEEGLVEAAKILIDAKASLAKRDDNKRQPLHLACREGHTEMARLLLESGAYIEAVQHQEVTALDDAAYWGHLEVVELLLDHGANSQVVCHDNCSPLHRATYQGHDKIVRALLKDNPANIDAPDGIDGLTALHYAIWNEDKEIVSILLAKGARLDVQDKDGWTPLMTATKRFPDYIRISYTPLLEASRNSELGSVRLLMDAGADCRARDKYGWTALHLASQTGNPSMVSLLLEGEKINIDALSNNFNTPLHLASGAIPATANDADSVSVSDELLIFEDEYEEGQYGTIIRYLLENGADPRAKNRDGETALHYAAASGDISRLESIMNNMNQEDMKTRNNKGWTALHSAFKGKDANTAMSSLLQSAKLDTADFGNDDRIWEEAVRWAASDSHNHSLAKLLFKGRPGASRPAVSSDWSAIEWAAHDQLPEVLEQLVDTSHDDDETEKALESALALVLESISRSSGGGVNARSAMVLSLLMSNSPRPNELKLRSALESVLALIVRPNNGIQTSRYRYPAGNNLERREIAQDPDKA
ncbi:unnamed protein product [Fusarium equiseti]|uniref:Ankyrin repeat protein n=1 Tax=Fusarium equiseti TaxID=61235 RepID=A0A8J2JD19_FUSEQ|nr:unnamed protein product [Fusarium equiseti]